MKIRAQLPLTAALLILILAMTGPVQAAPGGAPPRGAAEAAGAIMLMMNISNESPDHMIDELVDQGFGGGRLFAVPGHITDQSSRVIRDSFYNQVANTPQGGAVFTTVQSDSAFAIARGEGHRVFLPVVMRNPFPCFLDDFSDPDSGWNTGTGSGWSIDYLDGEYQILLNDNNHSAWGSPARALPGNYRIEVDARLMSDNQGAYSIVFGVDLLSQTTYMFTVYPTEQAYLIERRNADGTWTELEDEDYNPVINTGTAINRLRVDRMDTSIHAYVNEVLVATWDDDSFMGSGFHFGLGAYSYGEGAVDARFDNFEVCQGWLCNPLFVEDFSVSGRWLETDPGWGRFSYQDGEYEILIRNPDSWGFANAPLEGGLPRFAVDVDVHLAAGTLGVYGINFGQVDGAHFYNFRVHPAAQQYALFILNGTSWMNVTGWSTSPAINAGAAANHLRVERDGEAVRLYANGTLLTSLTDSTYLGNQEMSLYGASVTGVPVAMRYDNFTFSELP